MGTTTFSGPVVSKAGFITGVDAVATSVTSATLTLTSANGLADAYNGETIPLNLASGQAVTLPASSGSQATYTFFIGTSITSNSTTIKVANATDVMVGYASIGSAGTAGVFASAPTFDTVTLNGSTTGGLVGSIITVKDVATGYWQVSANLNGSGTAATPFSATVS